MENHFTLQLSSLDAPITVALNEAKFYESVYTNRSVYDLLQPETCFVIDATLAMGCTEAVVESYYSVMSSHFHSGNVANDTLDLRTMLDWCIKSDLSCPNTINKIAFKFLEGDKDHGLSAHRTPFRKMTDYRHKNYTHSKVVDRHLANETAVSYLT